MGSYTGEVIQEAKDAQGGAGAKPYTGEVIPMSKGAAPAAAPSPRADEPVPPPLSAGGDSTSGFVSGNLNIGLASLLGLPADTGNNILNLGKAAIGSTGRGVLYPKNEAPPAWLQPSENPMGGTQTFDALMRRMGLIDKSAEPQSPLGRYAASALQQIPSAMFGRPTPQQLPKAISAAATSGLGGEAAADIGGEDWRGVGSMMAGTGGMRDLRRGVSEDVFRMKPESDAAARALQSRQTDRFGKAKDMGIPIPPRELKVDKTAEKVAGAVREQLGLPAGTELTPEILGNYRKAHFDAYQAIVKDPALNGQIQSTPKFQTAIKNLAQEERKLRSEFPNATKDTGLQEVLADFVKPSYSTEGAMAQVQRLRESARSNLGSASATDDTRRLGLMQRRIANAMEDLIGENVQKIGKPELVKQWQEARQAMAQAHDVETALEPGGKVNPARLAALQMDGQPLSGQLKKIADVAGEFPGAVMVKPKNEDFFTHKVTPMALQHPEAAAAHWSTRMWDPLMKSAPVQHFGIDPASRLTPMQQQLIRYLSSAQQSNKGIPTPPQ